MLKELVLSFKENIRKKSSNPFWGTFIVIWSIKNWVLIYSIFNFKDSLSLESRLKYIQNYFESNPIIWTTLDTVWLTFVVLFVSYILLNLSRLIVNFFDKTVTPFVYKLSDRSSIVLKSDYDTLQERMFKLNDKLEAEVQKRVRIQEERDNLESQIGKLISEESESSNTNTEGKVSRLDKIIHDLHSDDRLEDFEHIVTKISTGQWLDDTDPYKYFSKKGIIKYVDSQKTSSLKKHKYELSEIGQQLREKLI